MKKASLIVVLFVSILLMGCFHKKDPSNNQDVPPVEKIDTIEVVVPPGDEVPDEAVDPSQPRDEVDGNGEFDPTKFQDDDIDEVMNLLKELTAE